MPNRLLLTSNLVINMDDSTNLIVDFFNGHDSNTPSGLDHLTTQPNILGGFDVFHQGTLLDHAVPNLQGGFDHHGAQGNLSFSTHTNILGGMDAYHNGVLVDHSTPNVQHGFDHHDASGHLTQSTHPNILGGVDAVNAAGQVDVHTQPNILGGLNIDTTQRADSDFFSCASDFHSKFFK